MYFNFSVQIVSLLVLVPMRDIKPEWLRYAVTLLPIAASGFSTSMYFARINAFSATIDQMQTQAVNLGLGSKYFVV